MIKLTVQSKSSPQTHVFNKKSVLIGNFSDRADIFLPHETLSSSCLEIIEEQDGFLAINRANDPFTALNGSPFWKKELQNQDVIEVGDTTILFEYEEDPIKKEIPTPKERSLEELHILIDNSSSSHVKELAASKKETSFRGTENDPIPLLTSTRFQMILGGLASVLLICFVLIGIAYSQFSNRIIEEEKKAAGAIADASMALVHAKIYNTKPHKQNWAYPDFLYCNLMSVLSPKQTSMLAINTQRQIGNTSYLLRIYTTNDQSRFLVIAQPAPSLAQWWMPKSAIVVDTESMVIRKIEDLRSLNRLLANPQPLDEANGEQVFALIEKGKAIPLTFLASKKNSKGFVPPKTLGIVKPGAELYVYNAPRYSQMGESVLKKALSLVDTSATQTDVAMLLNEIKAIKKFKDIIFYSSTGMQAAIEAQNALHTFVPETKFLIGYVKCNDKGQELGCHLLIGYEHATTHAETVIAEKSLPPLPKIPQAKPDPTTILAHADDPESDESHFWQENLVSEKERGVHPLFLKLQGLTAKRKEELKPFSKEIRELLKKNGNEIVVNFSEELKKRIDSYENEDNKHQAEIIASIKSLYKEHHKLPLETFMDFIKKAGLEALVRNSLEKRQEALGEEIIKEDEIAARLLKIDQAQYLEELEHHVNEAAKMLVIEKLPNPEKLIFSRSQVRRLVQKKLENFFLKAETKLPASAFRPETEGVFLNILQKAWITDPDEYNFYLREFHFLKDFYSKTTTAG